MNIVENSQQTRLLGLRDAMRSRINTILQNKIPGRTDAVSQEKFAKIAQMIENKLYRIAKTEEEYSDLRTLGTRTESLLKELQRFCLQNRVANNRRDQSDPKPEDDLTSDFRRMILR